jgi:SUKH-4 immunity protein
MNKLNHEMIEIFGQENLVYAKPNRIKNIDLPHEIGEFILNTGLPRVMKNFRFSMDFEGISEDIYLGERTKNLGQLFTIGCESSTQLIGTLFPLSEIDLDNNASLSDIERRIRILGIENDSFFHSEVVFSCRVCLDLDNNSKIISLNPDDLSIAFVNSSIQQLAASIVSFGRNFHYDKEFNVGVNDFKEALKKIDIKVLESENSVWLQVLESLILDKQGY